jgi:hypothetical protein
VKFSQRQVADPAAQQNFEQLERLVDDGYRDTGTVSVHFGAGSVESTGVNLPKPQGATTPVGCVATCNIYPGTGRVVGVNAYVTGGVFQINAEASTGFAGATDVTVSYQQWWK